MTKAEFCAWVERSGDRYEYVNGRAVPMPLVTRASALTMSNFLCALGTRMDRDSYDVAPSGFAVDMGDVIRFPAVLVEPAQTNGQAMAAKAPLLIIEILSPGSLHLDFGDKKREYLSLPTLDTYVVIAPDEPRVWIWRRADGAFSPEPEIIEGMDKALALPALGLEIPLSEIYRGVR
jgi:Uma2 family endonuclease